MQSSNQPDFEKLRLILESELGRELSLEYATGAGNFLINIYEVLVSDSEVTDEKDDKLWMDTT